jgi:hypothetical protein
VMDDLDFKLKMFHFKQRCSVGMAHLIELWIRTWKIQTYAYLHCNLLNRAALTTITLRVKSLHIKMHAKKHVCEGGIFLTLNQNPKGVLKKVTCMLSLQLSQQPLCHQFLHSTPS